MPDEVRAEGFLTVTAEQLRQALAKGVTYDQFFDLVGRLRDLPGDEVFGLLWPLALDGDLSVSNWAGCLLVKLEPWCPLSAEEALRAVAASGLNLSYREVPFYLAVQFGKRKVGKAYRAVAAEFPDGVPPELSGIAYWLSMPAVELAGWFVRLESRWGMQVASAPDSEPNS